MSFTYHQRTGKLCYQPTGTVIIQNGYSGSDDNTHGTNPACVKGKNNPADERLSCIGPIPRGRYEISPPMPSNHLGPLVFVLTPTPGTNTYGRSGFCIHGDSAAHPGCASEGCIIASYAERVALAAAMKKYGDTDLLVV